MYSTTACFSVLCTFLLLAVGCKIIPGYSHGAGPYQIVKLTGNIQGKLDSFIVAYNSKGFPVSLTKSHVDTSSPNYLLRYDKLDRLTDCIGVYTEGGAEVWYRYGYDDKKRIVKDTMYLLGNLATGPGTDFAFTSEYEYDALDRITRRKMTFAKSGDMVWDLKYLYDQHGNRQLVGEFDKPGQQITYDDKVNMLSLHPVWQFLAQDYSSNNVVQNITYNEYGLPLSISNSVEASKSAISFLDLNFEKLDITYNYR